MKYNIELLPEDFPLHLDIEQGQEILKFYTKPSACSLAKAIKRTLKTKSAMVDCCFVRVENKDGYKDYHYTDTPFNFELFMTIFKAYKEDPTASKKIYSVTIED